MFPQLRLGERLSRSFVPREECRDVEAARIINASGYVADRHDPGAGFVHEAGGVGAHIPESLDGDCRITDVQLQVAEGFEGHAHHTPAGGVFTSETPSDRKRFTRDDARNRVSDLLTVGIHDPGHDLGVGADVRSRHVLFRPDQRENLCRIATGEPLELRS